MPKKKEKPESVTLVRKVIAKGVSEDICDLGPGVLYQDEITYTNDRPGPFSQPQLAAQVVNDTQDLLTKLFSVEVEQKEGK
jgi:hypothetical protein